MCGRFYIDEEQNKELLDLVMDLDKRSLGRANIVKGEVYPSNRALVMVPSKKKEEPVLTDSMCFGFLSSKGGKPVINARSESALQKPLFSASVHNGRILIPASGFFEWDHSPAHAKYYFKRTNDRPLYMAGLSRICDGTECFVILTTASNDSLKDIHSRMPLILPEDKILDWLYDEKEAIHLLSYTPELLKKKCLAPSPSYQQMTLPFLS